MKQLLLVALFGAAALFIYRSLDQNKSFAPPLVPSASAHSLKNSFPDPGPEFELAFEPEKPGLIQAELLKVGSKLALLSLVDTTVNSTPGQPGATTITVANRYRIEVRSLVPSFSEADRQIWLEKFKLDQLK